MSAVMEMKCSYVAVSLNKPCHDQDVSFQELDANVRTYMKICFNLGMYNLKSQCEVHICYTHVYPHDFEYKHHIFIMSVNYNIIHIAAVILPASTQPPLATSSIPTPRMTSTGIETEPSTTIEVI